MDIKTLETWLWDASCVIRGQLDAPKYKDYILPMIFLKRLSDVCNDGASRFYIPEFAKWEAIQQQKTEGLGQYLTKAVDSIASENPYLDGVINAVKFDDTTVNGQRIIPDERLAALIKVLSRHRLGLSDVEPDILGRVYEYLLRKFAEGQGQSAGEFYTPREVGILMARLLDPEPNMTVYDPSCGSGGLLIKCHMNVVEKYGNASLRIFGQEINPITFALARMNAVIHNIDAEICMGDTMLEPAFKDSNGRLQTFDLIVANPMWNQQFDQDLYRNDQFDRFRYGIPPSSNADWGWMQHMLASLNEENGRMAVVLDTGAVSRGSGNTGLNRERDIRKAFVEADLIEAVILLPENLFYNTTAPSVIIVVNRKKRHHDEILLINASGQFTKGRPKNYLAEEHINAIIQIYHQWGDVKAKELLPQYTIITREEAARNDYNLSPSRYVGIDKTKDTVLPLEEALAQLKLAEEERSKAEYALTEMLRGLFT